MGPWTLEVQAAATFFTDNKDFFGGNTRSQYPIYSLKGHAIYGFSLGVCGSLDATYFTGDRTTLNGVESNDLQQRGTNRSHAPFWPGGWFGRRPEVGHAAGFGAQPPLE